MIMPFYYLLQFLFPSFASMLRTESNFKNNSLREVILVMVLQDVIDNW
jgi:hypothetical protein